ncbi:hypothetical protein [Uliginosibacterium sp. TH139]|uniref:hypothetical protein n=1 Tax=Uliginosibacterium sp. TH139 TaxID=2067453 RepID=UPI001180CEBC|nr:hypothetical protein [Uliginosibacterium sp. TH139]
MQTFLLVQPLAVLTLCILQPSSAALVPAVFPADFLAPAFLPVVLPVGLAGTGLLVLCLLTGFLLLVVAAAAVWANPAHNRPANRTQSTRFIVSPLQAHSSFPAFSH